MSLSHLMSAYLLFDDLDDLRPREGNVHCCGIMIICCEFIHYLLMLYPHASKMD